MGATFTVEMGQVVGYRLEDVTGGAGTQRYASYEAACAALVAFRATDELLPGCTDEDLKWDRDMIRVGLITDDMDAGFEFPQLKMCNANAAHVLDALGFADPDTGRVEEYCGSIAGMKLLARIDTALALAPADEGVPGGMFDGEGRVTNDTHAARTVECGRRPGYLQDKLHELRAVAVVAAEHGRLVTWG